MRSKERADAFQEAIAYLEQRRAERQIATERHKEREYRFLKPSEYLQPPELTPTESTSTSHVIGEVAPTSRTAASADAACEPPSTAETAHPEPQTAVLSQEAREISQGGVPQPIQGRPAVKGWVYVIFNKAMPGLVKVGYSMKDPELRASELNHTGSPHPYCVDYEMLVYEPRDVEQRAHKLLSDWSEGKEWFRCSTEEAVAVIKEVVAGREIAETYKQAEREAALLVARERAHKKEARRQAEAEINSIQGALSTRIAQLLQRDFPEPALAPYWIGWALAAMFLIAVVLPKATDMGTVILGAIIGFFAALFHVGHITDKQKNSAQYQAAIKKREDALVDVRRKVEAKYGLSTDHEVS